MPAPSLTLDLLFYGFLVLGVFLALWAYYDHRDRTFFDAGRRRISFHCVRCNHLYTERAGTATAPCPRCGHRNLRLQF